MREKASPAKKNHPSTPYPLHRRCPHRRRTPCFQFSPSLFVMFLFFLARAQQVSCGKITVLTSTKKKVRRVLARKSLPRTNQNSPSAFSHQIRNNSKKDKTKTSQMMGWIEKRPNKFLTQNFVRQGLPAKSLSVRFRFISLKYVRV